MMFNRILQYLKRFWRFIWYEDSISSWIVSVILAFVIVKFIIYPLLGLLLGTGYPVVAVVSGSMEHKAVLSNGKYEICGDKFGTKPEMNFDLYWATCGSFYQDIKISKEDFGRFRFKNGFNTGDVMVIYGVKPKDIKIGDVIVFRSNIRKEPIIHRVIETKEANGKMIFKTKGDHNSNSGIDDTNIAEDRLIGKAVFKLPFVGYVKIMFVKLLSLLGVGN